MPKRETPQFPGQLQQEIMRVVWRLGEGRVEDVRKELPRRRRGAYTTVQTVLNRLAERGLLGRRRDGKAIVYSPRISEGDYLARSFSETLAEASDDARRAALAQLVGDLDQNELDEIRALARQAQHRRGRQ
jgi:predicted transcriptional regulator